MSDRAKYSETGTLAWRSEMKFIKKEKRKEKRNERVKRATKPEI
jgi:hypothetical protein